MAVVLPQIEVKLFNYWMFKDVEMDDRYNMTGISNSY